MRDLVPCHCCGSLPWSLFVLQALPCGYGVSRSALIEEAVRLELDKKEGEAVSKQELLSIQDIYIWGDKVAADADAFHELMDDFVNNEGNITRGSITTLDDLQEMKNLQSISLVYQNITDLSPLSELVFLEDIDLHHNPIEDCFPTVANTIFKISGIILIPTSTISVFYVVARN